METHLDIQQKKSFLLLLAFFCLIFFGSQFYLSSHSLFTPDEFWVAHSVYTKYRISLPYRDFAPYKTVLGYYLFLIPLMLTQDPVTGLIYLKIFLTFINTVCLFICSLWCTRFFSNPAILVSLLILICSNFFISFPADIRVDLLAYWCSLISVILILEKRYAYAGILIGLAFCISQKVIWYGIAAEVALGLVWLLFQRNRKDLFSIILFNIGFMTIISLYLLFWISISNVNVVIDNVFYQAATVYKINLYDDIHVMLSCILKENLFYLIFWILSVLSLLVQTSNKKLVQRVFIIIFAWVSMFFIIVYKQPFFYYTIAVLPPLFLLYADFFTWLNDINHHQIKIVIKGRFLIYIFLVATLSILSVKIEFIQLPTPSMSIIMGSLVVMPVIIYVIMQQNRFSKFNFTILYLLVFISGILIPLKENFNIFLKEGYQYQQLAMRVVNQLIKEKSTYVAGFDLIYNKNQPISGNSFLEQNILFLHHPNDADLQKLLLASLDLSPSASLEKLITEINKQPVKIFIHSFFLDRFPPKLMKFLTSQYAYLWGNIYIYGPQFFKGRTTIDIKFSGEYKLESSLPIMLDGKKIMPHTLVSLNAKTYQSSAEQDYRLILQPKGLEPLPKKYYAEVPERLIEECQVRYINHKRVCVYFTIQNNK